MTAGRKPRKAKPLRERHSPRRWPPSAAALDRLLERATVDAHDEEERMLGLFEELRNGLRVPFEVSMLGVAVTVEGVELTEADGIVAVCRRGKVRQRVPVLDLPLPRPTPGGAEWIEAYRRLVRRG